MPKTRYIFSIFLSLTIVSTFLYARAVAAPAWTYSTSVAPYCNTQNNAKSVVATFNNNEPNTSSNSMDVTFTLSGHSDQIVTNIHGGSSGQVTFDLGGGAVSGGTVHFNMSWHDGHAGTDSGSKTFSAIPNCYQTATPTRTATPFSSPTNTDTPTPTQTKDPTSTSSPTSTNTDVPSQTPTNTELPSATPTDTDVPSATPTNTTAPSQTPTNTDTPVSSPTATNTPVDTPTETETVVNPSQTPTNTQTPVSSPTATPADTNTPTSTATNTAAPSATPTGSVTQTPTPTMTTPPTVSVTPGTETPTPTETTTPVKTETPFTPPTGSSNCDGATVTNNANVGIHIIVRVGGSNVYEGDLGVYETRKISWTGQSGEVTVDWNDFGKRSGSIGIGTITACVEVTPEVTSVPDVRGEGTDASLTESAIGSIRIPNLDLTIPVGKGSVWGDGTYHHALTVAGQISSDDFGIHQSFVKNLPELKTGDMVYINNHPYRVSGQVVVIGKNRSIMSDLLSGWATITTCTDDGWRNNLVILLKPVVSRFDRIFAQ